MGTTHLLSTMRDNVAAHRRERDARHTLERELSAYSTEADRADIEAMIDRYPSEDTAEIRQILANQAIVDRTRTASYPAVRAA
jgi:hypothetical protein